VRVLSSDIKKNPQPNLVIFDNPNTIVKFGRHIAVAEAQCLWIIKRVFHGKVPVPDVFG
jgi:hypothetical protein